MSPVGQDEEACGQNGRRDEDLNDPSRMPSVGNRAPPQGEEPLDVPEDASSTTKTGCVSKEAARFQSSPGRTRTYDITINSRAL